jgi:hypothetical protein
MTADPESRTVTIKTGYEQFVPPPVPPGMWFDRNSCPKASSSPPRAG